MTETVTGADGAIMHSLMEQGRTCTVTITLLKTSPVNAQLQQLINSQSQTSATWGDNVISIRDVVRGDDITVSDASRRRRGLSTGTFSAWPHRWIPSLTRRFAPGHPRRN
jgi:hypothetical protein